MSLLPHTRIGPYEILGPLGEGGMGEVYRALDPRLEREVAVKVLPSVLARDPDRLRRFELEARATAALNHPHILAVYDIGFHSGVSYLVAELLEGETLRECLLRGPLPWKKALELAAQTATGLAAAHDRGIVHRDVKPENLFLTREGRLKLLDFGLARIDPPAPPPSVTPAELARLPTRENTQPGVILGTTAYLSPEQVRGEAATARSDVFALGAVLHEMLSGRRPFARATAAETLAAILYAEPEPLAISTLPPAVERIVARCLQKRPEERFQSARDLAFALEAVSDAPPVRPAPAQAASIAVLPFADMSSARDQEYFCEGMAEELIHALGRVPGLTVASRLASFQFKGGNLELAQISERLKVATVLEGSVRRAGNRLRISVQLVEVASGYQRWSARWDRGLEDVFAVQDEIAASVARELAGVLDIEACCSQREGGTDSVEAYDAYLRGRRLFYRTRRRDFEDALDQFRHAIALDRQYARAWAGLADTCSWLVGWWGEEQALLDEAESASQRAVELAPELAEAHAARGQLLAMRRQWQEAEREFETAIRLDPRLFEAHYFYGRMCVARGETSQAVTHFEAAAQASPEDHQIPLLSISLYRALARPELAQAAARRGIVLARRHLAENPDDVRALYLLGGALIAINERAEGFRCLEQAAALAPGELAVLYNLACAYSNAGELERALDCLEQACASGWGYADWLDHDSDLDPLRSHPRYVAVRRKIDERKR